MLKLLLKCHNIKGDNRTCSDTWPITGLCVYHCFLMKIASVDFWDLWLFTIDGNGPFPSVHWWHVTSNLSIKRCFIRSFQLFVRNGHQNHASPTPCLEEHHWVLWLPVCFTFGSHVFGWKFLHRCGNNKMIVTGMGLCRTEWRHTNNSFPSAWSAKQSLKPCLLFIVTTIILPPFSVMRCNAVLWFIGAASGERGGGLALCYWNNGYWEMHDSYWTVMIYLWHINAKIYQHTIVQLTFEVNEKKNGN